MINKGEVFESGGFVDPVRGQLLWNDPTNNEQTIESGRGVGYEFSKQDFEEFLKKMGYERLIRAHEKRISEEVMKAFGNKLLSIFSATYGGRGRPFYVKLTNGNTELIPITEQAKSYVEGYAKHLKSQS